MKSQTLNRYIARIDCAVELLAAALAAGDPPPSLERLAEAARFSPFHFHRIYRALTGETLAQTVTRLRNDRAAYWLAHRRQVTDVALSSGFATPQAFARAFRAATGLTPSQARSQASSMTTLDEVQQTAPLSVRIESMEPLRLVVLRHVGDHRNLDTAYIRLFQWAGSQGLLDELRGLYGIAIDDPRDTPPAQTRFDAALGLNPKGDLPADLRIEPIPAEQYRVVRHRGAYAGLYPLLERVYLEVLIENALEPTQTPVLFQYLNEPDQTPEEELLTDIWLPVQAVQTE